MELQGQHALALLGGDAKGEMHEQCAWCTLVKSGPYAGMVVFEEKLEKIIQPVLVEGYSHGICSVCDAILRGAYHLKRAKKQMKLDLARDILRLEVTGRTQKPATVDEWLDAYGETP